MQPFNWHDVLEKIVEKDPRYHRDAYLFVREALDFTQRMASKTSRPEARHITGQELLAGIRDYALGQYGPMALSLLQEWGLFSTEDFGEIVFNMVDSGLLSKTESDSREDFKGGYDFEEAFRKPFLPETKQSSLKPPASQST